MNRRPSAVARTGGANAIAPFCPSGSARSAPEHRHSCQKVIALLNDLHIHRRPTLGPFARGRIQEGIGPDHRRAQLLRALDQYMERMAECSSSHHFDDHPGGIYWPGRAISLVVRARQPRPQQSCIGVSARRVRQVQRQHKIDRVPGCHVWRTASPCASGEKVLALTKRTRRIADRGGVQMGVEDFKRLDKGGESCHETEPNVYAPKTPFFMTTTQEKSGSTRTLRAVSG